jgi:hypothetical protein
MKILGISWLDTATYSGWRNDTESLKASLVYSIGFLVEETRACVKLAATISEGGQPADVTVIPKRAIIKRNVFKL